MIQYLECKLLYTTWAPCELLTCCHEIPSSLWVAVCLLGSIWIADMLPWNPIQLVSCCVPPGLHLDCWCAAMKSHPAGELLCASWASFELLTCPWNSIQDVSCCVPPGLYLICWHIAMISLPASELLCTFWVLYCWHTIIIIISSLCLSSFILFC